MQIKEIEDPIIHSIHPENLKCHGQPVLPAIQKVELLPSNNPDPPYDNDDLDLIGPCRPKPNEAQDHQYKVNALRVAFANTGQHLASQPTTLINSRNPVSPSPY